MRSKGLLPAERAELAEIATGKSDFTRRRLRVGKEDLETSECTAGCPGCRAVNRGRTATNHSEVCRKRFADELDKVGDEMLARETAMLFECLEEAEKEKENEKTSEVSGDSKAGASSSGPATTEREAPRSKGGVPMAADSGDRFPETVKRKLGDPEPRESEDSKDKKNKTGKEE